MALNIADTKCVKKPKDFIEKSIPKYKCNLTFKSKVFDFINLPKILKSQVVYKSLPSNFDSSETLNGSL